MRRTLNPIHLLLVSGLFVLWCGAEPLCITHSGPPVEHMVPTQAADLPDSVAVRGFTAYAPVGREALDQRAEIIFDN